VATRELVVEPPYTSIRNPMALGAIAAYLGLAVVARSPGTAALVALLAAALLAYIRLVEEPELSSRFGAAYREYRARTPFLVPRSPRFTGRRTRQS